MIILILTLWWLSGSLGFIFWWTKDFDLTSADIIVAFCLGLLGPAAWVIGYLVHGGKRTVFKKRD